MGRPAQPGGAGGGIESLEAIESVMQRMRSERVLRHWLHVVIVRRWEAKANAAEAKNERVSGLLTRYAYRNQLLLPGMPACVASARASS